jgi:hypothetical protein
MRIVGSKKFHNYCYLYNLRQENLEHICKFVGIIQYGERGIVKQIAESGEG